MCERLGFAYCPANEIEVLTTHGPDVDGLRDLHLGSAFRCVMRKREPQN
jgi:hypothetical protein